MTGTPTRAFFSLATRSYTIMAELRRYFCLSTLHWGLLVLHHTPTATHVCTSQGSTYGIAHVLGLQVVAGLLEESSGKSVYARRYCPGGYTWKQHLADAQNPNRSLYRLLGEGGKKHWDYVIFQVLFVGQGMPGYSCKQSDSIQQNILLLSYPADFLGLISTPILESGRVL